MQQRDRVVSTGTLRYWDGGPPEAPAVLLLHSAFSDAAFSWSPIWDDLAATCRVIAPDIPGFGASPAPRDVTLAMLASAVCELLDQLGVARATVVGNSFGVSVAIALADRYPECVERLVLVNGTALASVSGVLRRILAIPAVDRAISRMSYRTSFGGPTAIRNAFPHASPGELAAITARVDREGPAHFETMKSCLLHSAPRKPSVAAPATLLWGADDRFTPLTATRGLSRLMPGAELVTIAHAGHLPQRDQPREFVARLRTIMSVAGANPSAA